MVDEPRQKAAEAGKIYRYVFNDAEIIILFAYKSGFAFGCIQLAFRTIYKNGYTAFKGQSFGLKRPYRPTFLAHQNLLVR